MIPYGLEETDLFKASKKPDHPHREEREEARAYRKKEKKKARKFGKSQIKEEIENLDK